MPTHEDFFATNDGNFSNIFNNFANDEFVDISNTNTLLLNLFLLIRLRALFLLFLLSFYFSFIFWQFFFMSQDDILVRENNCDGVKTEHKNEQISLTRKNNNKAYTL